MAGCIEGMSGLSERSESSDGSCGAKSSISRGESKGSWSAKYFFAQGGAAELPRESSCEEAGGDRF